MIRVRDFKGMIPARDPRLLPAGYAKNAINCDLDRGTILPIRATTDNSPSVWTFLGGSGVDVVPANVSGVNRLLVSGLIGHPEAREGSTTRRWGVVSPGTIPTVSKGGEPTEDAAVRDTVSYCYTLVTAWGEESAISGASMPVDVYDGEYIILSNFDVPSISGSGNDFQYVRVYRVETGASGAADFQNVAVRPNGPSGSSYFDVPASEISSTGSQLYDSNSSANGINSELGAVAMTEGWDPPPDGAEGGVEFANGVYALFKGKQVFLSVPGYYYAFPHQGIVNYSFELQYGVVGLGVYNHQLIVCTEANPEIISGVDPASASRYQFPNHQPCQSKASVVSTPYGVFYVSREGGVVVTDGGVQMLTRDFFTPAQWQAYPLTDAICAYWQRKIFVFFQGRDSGFVIDMHRRDVVMLENFGGDVTGVFVDEEEDRLYIDTSLGWRRWADSSSYLGATYETGILPVHPTSYACARVDGNFPGADSVSLSVHGDGETVLSRSVASPEAFRLPGGKRYREWRMKVETTGGPEIHALFLAHGMAELRDNT